VPDLEAVTARYRMLVGDEYLALIDPAEPDDPIRKQALPDVAELLDAPGELRDPIGDRAHEVAPNLVHRYPDRVLFFPTFLCPMYCRYCFRKVALNEAPVRLDRVLPAAVEYVSTHPEVREVILSGGDPLMLSDDRLAEVLGAFRTIPSVERLRLHTRVPVTRPSRVTAALAGRLAGFRPLYVVTHYNHPRELSPAARAAVSALVDAGLTVLNQAVLLRGVNDDVETLAALFSGLLRWQVRPYYLHHPDMTVGTAHFRVPISRGLALVRALRGRLTGLAWPTYVLDIPGGGGKVPVDSDFVRPTARDGVYSLHGPLGGRWTYVDPAVHPDGLDGVPAGATRLED
jgi:lysine 2,3-aminomutase